MSYTVVGVQLACQLPLCVERVYSRTLKSFPLFLELQLIYLTLYHATSLKMLWRLEEVKSTLLFPAPASAARRTALNPGWQSCFGCPCVNVIVEQFFFFPHLKPFGLMHMYYVSTPGWSRGSWERGWGHEGFSLMGFSCGLLMLFKAGVWIQCVTCLSVNRHKIKCGRAAEGLCSNRWREKPLLPFPLRKQN